MGALPLFLPPSPSSSPGSEATSGAPRADEPDAAGATVLGVAAGTALVRFSRGQPLPIRLPNSKESAPPKFVGSAGSRRRPHHLAPHSPRGLLRHRRPRLAHPTRGGHAPGPCRGPHRRLRGAQGARGGRGEELRDGGAGSGSADVPASGGGRPRSRRPSRGEPHMHTSIIFAKDASLSVCFPFATRRLPALFILSMQTPFSPSPSPQAAAEGFFAPAYLSKKSALSLACDSALLAVAVATAVVCVLGLMRDVLLRSTAPPPGGATPMSS